MLSWRGGRRSGCGCRKNTCANGSITGWPPTTPTGSGYPRIWRRTGAGSPGTATIWANVDAEDGAALDQRLDALADTVCEHDPRSRERRRADAIGPLARLEAQLACRCGRDDCPAAQKRAAADAAVVHV